MRDMPDACDAAGQLHGLLKASDRLNCALTIHPSKIKGIDAQCLGRRSAPAINELIPRYGREIQKTLSVLRYEGIAKYQ